MQVPVDIRFRHVESSEALEAAIRERVATLEHFSDRITTCHVTVDHQGGHHKKGAGAHFHVSIRVTLPGVELFVGRDPQDNRDFEDAYAAVNAAFDAMKRQLQEAERIARHEVKQHRPPAQA